MQVKRAPAVGKTPGSVRSEQSAPEDEQGPAQGQYLKERKEEKKKRTRRLFGVLDTEAWLPLADHSGAIIAGALNNEAAPSVLALS